MTKFLLFIIILNFVVVGYNFYMWFTVQKENTLLKNTIKENTIKENTIKENQIGYDFVNNNLREIIIEKNKKINNLEYEINIINNDKSFKKIHIEDNYRKLLLEKFTELREYYEDEYFKKELGTFDRLRFVGIVYGLYEAISIINQIDEYIEKD